MIGIVFDLDGTLLDTLEDLTDSTNAALQHFGYPKRTREEIRSFVGNGAQRQITRALPEGAEVAPVLEYYREYYRDHCRIKTAPYAGIPEALAGLAQKYPVGIVSNKPDPAVRALCEQHFPGIFALGELPDCPRKPAPDMVRLAERAIGAERCIYVGDSEVDLLTAKNAQVPCLSVLWGFRDREALEAAGAARFCEDPIELIPVLEAMILEMQ